MMEEFLKSLLPIVSFVLTAIAGIGVAYLKKRFDVTLETSDREALHSALQTGVNAAIAKLSDDKVKEIILAPITDTSVKQLRDGVVAGAIDYAKVSVPEALKRLDPSVAVLSTIAIGKLEGLLRGQKSLL